jgi:hypothetical protein
MSATEKVAQFAYGIRTGWHAACNSSVARPRWAVVTDAGPELRLVTRRGFGYQLADGAGPGVAAPH